METKKSQGKEEVLVEEKGTKVAGGMVRLVELGGAQPSQKIQYSEGMSVADVLEAAGVEVGGRDVTLNSSTVTNLGTKVPYADSIITVAGEVENG